MSEITKIAIVGGGAAGFFAAIECANNYKLKNKEVEITIFEQAKDVLQKVRISGGGRCNLTHACWIPKELVKNYPRGSQELLGPFHTFCCGDTVAWFAERGVETKIEEDGRMFPVTNNSQTIIDCLLGETRKLGIKVLCKQKMTNLSSTSLTEKSLITEHSRSNKWELTFNKEKQLIFDKVMLATGSSKAMWQKLENLGLPIIQPVPSLFTFNIKNELIKDLMGLSMSNVNIKVMGTKLEAFGPLLITHWGLSGPAILKLSAWGARILNEKNYDFKIQVNFTGTEKHGSVLKHLKQVQSKQQIHNSPQFDIPKRLWHRMLDICDIPKERTWMEFGKKSANKLATLITQAQLEVKGKSTFKDEFVTAGGIDLKEIDFKRFESKRFPNLYFAGEVLNIDAITGGFNFQAAWTGGYIAGKALSE